MKRILSPVASILLLALGGCLTTPATHPVQPASSQAQSSFKSELGAVPWTHLNFPSEAADFHFAVVADRCGGHRAGIFEDAMDKLNLLQPEFVMCVGDLIEGYSTDVSALDSMWREVTDTISHLDMPFFRVPGNHDTSNPTMDVEWDKLFGKRYYWFNYKDALFLCLNSQDNDKRAGLSATQIAWAKDVIAKQAKARWTFVFMHQPLWIYDEGNLETSRKSIKDPQDTGFAQIESALAGRNYTVIAGHFHQYTKFVRHGMSYYILASTGGASALRGPPLGEFDHIVWASMRSAGPVFANLTLGGILKDDVYSEKHLRASHGMKFQSVSVSDDAKDQTVIAPIVWTNSFAHAANITLSWYMPPDCAWTVTPCRVETSVQASAVLSQKFQAVMRGPSASVAPLPVMNASLVVTNELSLDKSLALPFDIRSYFLARLPESACRKASGAITIDGKLDEADWQAGSCASTLFSRSLDKKPTVNTHAWFCYDPNNLYVAVRCFETNLTGLTTTTTQRDGNCWEDDSVEFFLVTEPKTNLYYQFIITASGVVYEAKGFDKQWNGEWAYATGRERTAWTVEMSIPWKTLGIRAPAQGHRLGMELVRSRPQSKEVMQWAPAPNNNHDTKMYGFLCFDPNRVQNK